MIPVLHPERGQSALEIVIAGAVAATLVAAVVLVALPRLEGSSNALGRLTLAQVAYIQAVATQRAQDGARAVATLASGSQPTSESPARVLAIAPVPSDTKAVDRAAPLV